MKTLNQRTTLILALAGAAVVAATAVFTPGCTCGPRVGDQTIKVDHLSYHGWTNALRLSRPSMQKMRPARIGSVPTRPAGRPLSLTTLESSP